MSGGNGSGNVDLVVGIEITPGSDPVITLEAGRTSERGLTCDDDVQVCYRQFSFDQLAFFINEMCVKCWEFFRWKQKVSHLCTALLRTSSSMFYHQN